MVQRLDSLDPGRGLWIDLGWRALQVFIATMLVSVTGTDFLAAAKHVKFWEDAVGAAIVAILTQLLALASSRAGLPAAPDRAVGPPGPPQGSP